MKVSTHHLSATIFQCFSIIPHKDHFNKVHKACCDLLPTFFPISPLDQLLLPDPQSSHSRQPQDAQLCEHTIPTSGHTATLTTLRIPNEICPVTISRSSFPHSPKQHFLFAVHSDPFTCLLNTNSTFSLCDPMLPPYSHTVHTYSFKYTFLTQHQRSLEGAHQVPWWQVPPTTFYQTYRCERNITGQHLLTLKQENSSDVFYF